MSHRPVTRQIRHHAHVAAATAQVVRPAVARQHGHHGRVLGDAQGITLVPERAGRSVISRPEMAAAVAALKQLPPADLALVASHHVRIHLLPVSGLAGGLLGATTILQDPNGSWYPTEIKIAAHAGLGGDQSLGEIVQHEFGHAVSVLRSQDRSEDAAIAYAASH